MSKIRFLAVVLATFAALGTVPSYAGQGMFADLPASAPLPSPRPASVDGPDIAAVVAPAPVLSISTVAQPIPEARQNVRIVGAKFLPDLSETDAKAVTETRNEHLLVQMVERLWVTAARKAWTDAKPVQAASATIAAVQ